jgi:hypothetical protein
VGKVGQPPAIFFLPDELADLERIGTVVGFGVFPTFPARHL